jgi:hypothetical protein
MMKQEVAGMYQEQRLEEILKLLKNNELLTTEKND